MSRLAGGLAAGLVALLALAVAAPAVLDAEALGRLARDKVRSTLKRELQIRNLRLQLLPAPTIRLGQLALSNPSWASQAQLLQAEDVSVRLEWLPLLRGRLVVSGIAARQLRLNLETDAQGRNSWDMPPGADAKLDWKRLRHADIAQALIWRSRGADAPQQWQLQAIKARSAAQWKQLHLSGDWLAHGQSLHLMLKLDDAAGLGRPGASSEGLASLETPGARLQLSGLLPLSAGLEHYALKARLDLESPGAVRRFFGGQEQAAGAPLQIVAELKRAQAAHRIEKADIKLGAQRFTGSAEISAEQPRWRLRGELSGERLDWAQALLDLGNSPPEQKPEDELLPTRPFAWPQLAALLAADADFVTRIGTLVTRSGVELTQWQARLQWSQNAISLADARFHLLGGSGSARLQLLPRRQEMQLQLQLHQVSLQEWFRRQGRRADMVRNGPLDVKTELKSRGDSWKELAANASGPLHVRLGPTSVHSKKAREAQALLVNLVPALSKDKAEEVHLACLSSDLQFNQGRAQSRQAVGLRSDASKLLLSGSVDLRSQRLDLSGRVRAADGVTLGIAALAGDVRIAGPLVKPRVSVEPAGALARVGAAIVTSGLSVLATAAYDAATAKEDPCVLAARGSLPRLRPAREPQRTADTR